MNKTLKIVLEIVLAILAVFLVWVIYRSIKHPVDFDKERAAREQVAIQRLKDIRDLEVAYKSVTGHYTDSADSLVDFYNGGKIPVVMQIGSQDDSLAVANTEALKKKNRKLTDQDLYAMYQQDPTLPLVFSIRTEIPVRDTIFSRRDGFVVDSLRYIPFSGGQKVEMEAVVKKVSGVDVPLFEARMPFKALLKGMDNQLRINLDAEREAQSRYKGLQVGSVSAPNNNAGNWE